MSVLSQRILKVLEAVDDWSVDLCQVMAELSETKAESPDVSPELRQEFLDIAAGFKSIIEEKSDGS